MDHSSVGSMARYVPFGWILQCIVVIDRFPHVTVVFWHLLHGCMLLINCVMSCTSFHRQVHEAKNHHWDVKVKFFFCDSLISIVCINFMCGVQCGVASTSSVDRIMHFLFQ